MTELNDETIISVLQDKENVDTLDKSLSSSFDALLEKSPLKSDNRNNLTLEAGSSSDEDTVKSVRRRIKRFSDSDSEVEGDKENINKPSLEKTILNDSSDSEDEPRKSRLVFNDSSDDDMTRKNESAKLSDKKGKQNKNNVSSDSEHEILPNKSSSKAVANDSVDDDDLSRINESAKISDKKRKQDKTNMSSDSEDEIFPQKSRLVTNNSSDDNTSPKNESGRISDNTSPKNESARISDKRSKLHNKFKGLLSSRSKAPEAQKSPRKSSDDENNSNSESSSGIESIKKKIKQKSALLKSGICDPDTSSDEESSQIQTQKKKKTNQKSAIMISPKKMSKPARMSAKQAMENMQKIKSESNRMLREKEVTLPYHRPKALSLKDIMNRRKPALSADGKALPIKMNSDQLKQYVKLLEQRNKEMMELCKSESEEEEETNENPTDANKESDPVASAQDCNAKDVTDDNVVKNYEKEEENEIQNVNQTEENIVPPAKVIEETEDNELPELTVEIVQKEPNLSNTDIPENDDVDMKDASDQNIAESETNTKLAAEIESQLMELRYDTEKMRNTEDIDNAKNVENLSYVANENVNTTNGNNDKSTSEVVSATVSDTDKAIQENATNNFLDDDFGDDFSDVDINLEDLDSIIENANDDVNAVDSPMLIRDPYNLNKKPKLTGAPGMVIDLDGGNPVEPRKLTGVELLKERFTYFSKLRTPEEKERERELTIKPGMLHLKLKQDLEEKISEQRSLEWAKRVEEEKQHREEMNTIRGDDSDGDDLEKIEAKLQEKEVLKESSSDSEEDEEEEDDCVMKDKPRKKNPMIDDEAEVSDDEEIGNHDHELANKGEENVNESADADDEEYDEDSEESSEESSEDEQENESKPKKGRILKAFEDSDDESTYINDNPTSAVPNNDVNNIVENTPTDSQILKDSQDDVLPLAQTNQSLSEDLFASQASGNPSDDTKKISDEDCADMTTQTFSILNTIDQSKTENDLTVPVKIDVICETQSVDDANLDDVVGMCSGKFTQTQNVIPAESQLTQSQCPIGEDILELCTGKFYDSKFVSQVDEPENCELKEKSFVSEILPSKKPEENKDLLDSILKEMAEPVEEPIKKKYVFDNATENEAVCFETVNNVRKKFTIDSDDEAVDANKPAKKKKLKKRKLEKRALQISDDEEEEEQLQSDEEADEYMSEVEEEDAAERIVEYDSEENEVEVKPQKQKKNRKMADFFEQEAELTSEDEWVGSGDEDERGLDRMEREEGDDDTFHQGRLQRELGQIHMRDVLDQDKREVRLIQELLFEDGDLGDGHRQRKFRWKNLDGDEEGGAGPRAPADSQEPEEESEEQWRKQRHEREVFLRSLKEQENEGEQHNISIDRSTIIKANLCSKTMSGLLVEAGGTGAGSRVEEPSVLVEKKKEEAARNLHFPVFQQNYHGSLLTRGRGALARLAALAMPLASEADEARPAAAPANNRNFVFAAVTPPAKEAKAPKRKADVNIGTPRLIKKFKTDDKQKFPKASLLDHLKAL